MPAEIFMRERCNCFIRFQLDFGKFIAHQPHARRTKNEEQQIGQRMCLCLRALQMKCA